MEWLRAFWEANRNEVLMTAFVILSIQLITGLGGAIKRRTHMRRIENDPK